MTTLDMSNDKIYSEAKEIADSVYKTPCEAKQLLIIDEYKQIKQKAIEGQIEAERKAKEYIESNKLDT